jgi:hypothetical protein
MTEAVRRLDLPDELLGRLEAGTAMAIVSLVSVMLISLPVIRPGDRFVNYGR